MSLVGTEYDVALWFSGHEPEDTLSNASQAFQEGFQRAADRDNVDFGPAEWSLLSPGDEGCPEVPKWLEAEVNEKGRRRVILPLEAGKTVLEAYTPVMLVCTRKVSKVYGKFTLRSFLADLTPEDLARLRRITQRKWLEKTGGEGPLTDSEADVFIERIGPEAARNLILSQTVH
jgi:hypothetical protein